MASRPQRRKRKASLPEKANNSPLSSKTQTEDQMLMLSESQLQQLIENCLRERIEFQHLEHFSGPYPHPQHAAEYSKVYPDFMPRVMALSEREQQNYQEFNQLQIANEYRLRRLGLLLAFVVIALFIISSFFLLFYDHAISGGLNIVVAIVVSYFVLQNYHKNAKPGN